MVTANSSAQIMAWFDAKVRNLNDNTRRVAKELADDGADLTRHFIETRGTEKSGKAGRIETGAMLESVSSGTVKDTPNEIITRFGYHDGPPWIRFQEPGFMHVSGVAVRGTYALSDASEAIWVELRREVGRAVRKA